ncbi:MAG: 50S ribosomal protein L27 [Candidatus Azambacteria bacterium]|jgi:large subunit ribosomal protein L27|nr:50S ribosomal protein L27 [Candidatus Azambacteria bacterium]
MAHTKAAGSTQLGRESHSKRLGVKLFDGEKVKVGDVIIRQRGTKWLPGENVKRGNDDTLYALKTGNIKFITKKIKRFNGLKRVAKMVKVQ